LLTGKLNEIGFRQMANSFSDTKSFSKMLDSGRRAVANAKEMEPATKLLFGTFFTALDGLQSKNALRTAPKADEKAEAKPGESAKDQPKSTVGWMPVKVTVSKLSIDRTGEPPSSFAISFPQGIVWGLAGCVGAFAVSLANERSRGTLMRLTTAPLTRSSILLGKALGCFITSVVVQGLLLIMARLAFGVELKDPIMLTIAVLASSFGFVGVMMFMAGMMKSEEGAGGMARAFVLVLAMIGGGSIPLVFMPKVMQTISNISPFKWASEAIQGALWRGFSFADMALPVGVLIVIGVVGYAVGAASFNRQQG
jgi:ABC-2 type transport system permease protein